jgi:cytochrome c biogenesis protein
MSLLASRQSVACQFIIFLLVFLVTTVIPQRPLPGPHWLTQYASVYALAQALQLDNIYGSPWFVLLAVVFTVTLSLSCYDQYLQARRVLSAPPSPKLEGRRVALPFASALAAVREQGYTPVGGTGGERVRLICGRGAAAGGVLLHAGILLAVLFSLVYAFTLCRIGVRPTTGAPQKVSELISAERMGKWPRNGDVPELMTLARLTPEFYPSGQLRMVTSELVLQKGVAPPQRLSAAVSSKAHSGSLKIYQTSAFGIYFPLQVDGSHWRNLYLNSPMRNGGATYLTEEVPLGPYTLKAKYLQKVPGDPTLTLRLMHGAEVVGEGSIRKGEVCFLGPYMIGSEGSGWWTDLLLEASYGTSGIFAGFFMMILGGALGYFSALREVVLWHQDGATFFAWRAYRFRDFYRDEESALLQALQGESP